MAPKPPMPDGDGDGGIERSTSSRVSAPSATPSRATRAQSTRRAAAMRPLAESAHDLDDIALTYQLTTNLLSGAASPPQSVGQELDESMPPPPPPRMTKSDSTLPTKRTTRSMATSSAISSSPGPIISTPLAKRVKGPGLGRPKRTDYQEETSGPSTTTAVEETSVPSTTVAAPATQTVTNSGWDRGIDDTVTRMRIYLDEDSNFSRLGADFRRGQLKGLKATFMNRYKGRCTEEEKEEYVDLWVDLATSHNEMLMFVESEEEKEDLTVSISPKWSE